MRLLFFIVCASALISCSQSPSDKAKESIKSFLKEHMNDFKSYEPIKFGTLDSVFTEYFPSVDIFDSLVTAEVDTSSNAITMRVYDKDSKEYYESSQKMNAAIEVINRLRPQVDKARNEFMPEFKGYKMNHTLRGKNGFGAIMLYNRDFYFNKDLKVINMVDLEKEK